MHIRNAIFIPRKCHLKIKQSLPLFLQFDMGLDNLENLPQKERGLTINNKNDDNNSNYDNSDNDDNDI